MKIKVITIKDITKYLTKFGFIFGIIAIIANFFYGKRNVRNYLSFNSAKLIPVISKEIVMFNQNNKIDYINQKKRYIKNIISSEVNVIKMASNKQTSDMFFDNNFNFSYSGSNYSVDNNIDDKIEPQISDENISKDEKQGENLDVPVNVATEVLPSNIPDKTTYEIFGVKLRCECDYDLSKEITDLDADFNKNNVLIFHTHTCESYTPTENYSYESTGNYRTTDLNYTVARVGDELEKYLNNYGINVIHDKSYHDYPSYNGSYNRSLITVKKLLEQNSETDVVIDLHRDAIGDNTYAPKVKIGDDYCARIMFVIGTDGGGLSHSGWRNNLKFAMKVVQKGNELYPRFV